MQALAEAVFLAMRRILAVGALAVLVVALGSGAAANLNVPPSRAGVADFAVTGNDLKPPQCAAIWVTNLIVLSGTSATGTGGNDLILGNALDNSINGADGDDCILGGAGNDNLRGGSGDDVVLGGPGNDWLRGEAGNDALYGQDGNDTLNGGAGTDVCNGGPGLDTFTNCETVVP